MTTPIASLHHVSKFYRKVMGLNDFTIGFPKGMTGLLGPNGSGKSTMIKLLTGQIKPSKGILRVLGSSPWDNPLVNNEIGYCPEQDSFFKGMTGYQFVTFNARMNGHSHRRSMKLARSAIRKVDMKKDANRMVAGYSKGMRQRIKVAQALVNDPQILFLDEPLAGTDPIGRVELMKLLQDLRMEGKDIIVSSHVLYEIERLTTNIVIINKGRLVAAGNLHDIRESMDRYPLTIRIKTDDRKKMGKLLMDLDNVRSVSFGEEKQDLLVRSSSPGDFYPELQKIIVNHDLTLSSIDSPDDNLDAIFRYLVD